MKARGLEKGIQTRSNTDRTEPNRNQQNHRTIPNTSSSHKSGSPAQTPNRIRNPSHHHISHEILPTHLHPNTFHTRPNTLTREPNTSHVTSHQNRTNRIGTEPQWNRRMDARAEENEVGGGTHRSKHAATKAAATKQQQQQHQESIGSVIPKQ